MAYSRAVRANVRTDYIGGMALARAAERHHVPVETVRRWKKSALKNGDDWDHLRSASILTGESRKKDAQEVLGQFKELFQEAMSTLKADRKPSPAETAKILASLADSSTKIVNAFSRVHPEISHLGVAMEVLELLGEHVRIEQPDTQEAFVDILEPFGKKLMDHYG